MRHLRIKYFLFAPEYWNVWTSNEETNWLKKCLFLTCSNLFQNRKKSRTIHRMQIAPQIPFWLLLFRPNSFYYYHLRIKVFFNAQKTQCFIKYSSSFKLLGIFCYFVHTEGLKTILQLGSGQYKQNKRQIIKLSIIVQYLLGKVFVDQLGNVVPERLRK